MDRAAIKQEAKNILKGNWAKLVIIFALYNVISLACEWITEINEIVGVILSLAFTVLSIPLSYGLIMSFVKTYKKEQVNYFDFFVDGINNFKNSWGVFFRRFLKLLPKILISILIPTLIIIPVGSVILSNISDGTSSVDAILISTTAILGIIGIWLILFYILAIILIIPTSLYYQLAEYIKIENNDITSKEAVEKSKEIMTGNRAKWFMLGLSFIGWIFLVAFGVSFVLGLISGLLGIAENNATEKVEEI